MHAFKTSFNVRVFASAIFVVIRSGGLNISFVKLNTIGLLESRFQKLRMNVNTDKFCIRLRDYCPYSHPIKTFGPTIEPTSETNYFNTILNENLKLKFHISCLLRKYKSKLRQIYSVLNKSSINIIHLTSSSVPVALCSRPEDKSEKLPSSSFVSQPLCLTPDFSTLIGFLFCSPFPGFPGASSSRSLWTSVQCRLSIAPFGFLSVWPIHHCNHSL